MDDLPESLEADRYLEEYRFAEAHDAYRNVLLHGETSSRAVMNLGVAETEEQLAFLRTLGNTHPENIEYQLMLARKMLGSRKAYRACLLCGELLCRQLRPRDRFIVRRLRFKAALLAGRFEFMSEDLANLWTPPEPLEGGPRYRLTFLRKIAALSDSDAIPVLRSIANEPWVERPVATFLALKADELGVLAGMIVPETE